MWSWARKWIQEDDTTILRKFIETLIFEGNWN